MAENEFGEPLTDLAVPTAEIDLMARLMTLGVVQLLRIEPHIKCKVHYIEAMLDFLYAAMEKDAPIKPDTQDVVSAVANAVMETPEFKNGLDEKIAQIFPFPPPSMN